MFIVGLATIIYIVMAVTGFTTPGQILPAVRIPPGSELHIALMAVNAILLVVASCHIWRSRTPSS